MMPVFLAVLMICLTAAGPVRAGAWLQEPGHVFFAATSTLRAGDPEARLENTLYLEYGLAPRVTLGLDLNQRPGIAGHALAFVRLPLTGSGHRTRVAAEAAIGRYHWRGHWHQMAKVTLSLGRGFRLGRQYGWMAVDAAIEHRAGSPAHVYKLDATAGLSGPNRIRPILQIETARISGLPLLWTLTPGLTVDSRNGTTWLIGIERKSVLRDTIGLKLGLWRRF